LVTIDYATKELATRMEQDLQRLKSNRAAAGSYSPIPLLVEAARAIEKTLQGKIHGTDEQRMLEEKITKETGEMQRIKTKDIEEGKRFTKTKQKQDQEQRKLDNRTKEIDKLLKNGVKKPITNKEKVSVTTRNPTVIEKDKKNKDYVTEEVKPIEIPTDSTKKYTEESTIELYKVDELAVTEILNTYKEKGEGAYLLVMWNNGERSWTPYQALKKEFGKIYNKYLEENNVNEEIFLSDKDKKRKKKVLANAGKKNQNGNNDPTIIQLKETETCSTDSTFHKNLANYRSETNASYCGKGYKYFEKMCDGACNLTFTSNKVSAGKRLIFLNKHYLDTHRNDLTIHYFLKFFLI
jgi:hypothetical protein